MPTRTFLALPLDEGIVNRLVKVQQALADSGAQVRWVERENLHLTLKFLGNVFDEQLAEVCRVAKAIAAEAEPFEFAIRGVEAVPATGQLRMVWVGIDEPTGRLAALNDAAERAYSDLGFKQENRQYRPHLTLGRVKSGQGVEDLRHAAGQHRDADFGAQGADELIVFSSHLEREGPVYSPLATLALGEAEPEE